MAEFDSDLEEENEEVVIHNDNQHTISNSKPAPSKKRALASVTAGDDDGDEDGNHYSSNSSTSKKAKLNDASEEMNLQEFVEDSDEDDEHEADNDDEDSDLNVDETDQDELLRFDDSAEIQQVEFELKDMREAYYHEVKDILGATEWEQKKLHVGLLADAVVKQEEIGGVLCVDESMLGFITLLSFKKYSEHLSLAHIQRFLGNKCKNKATKKKFDHLFGGAFNIGLLLHERPLNTPLQLIPLIYESLRQDIEYATDKKQASHLSDDDLQLFKMDYVLLVVRYRWNPVVAPQKNKDKKKKKNKKDADQEESKMDQELEDMLLPHYKNDRTKMKLVYEHMEHQLFVDKAQFQCDFERFDKIWNMVLIKMDDFNTIVEGINDLFGSDL